ncbi:hypothetical protein KJR08_05530 [Streptococcus lutetiensis]|uniref:hypothetical protein n=1 Tax=Streptococcus lutetiensis TaxID=150055 RepID=UPI001BDAA716|nr:hypothetical protein [Streptococcus lutetiensis]MBT0947802.1 hypothetical protein [Streptococcus lutetiensis]
MINLIMWLLAIATFFVGVIFGIGVAESKQDKTPVINDERLQKRITSAVKDWLEEDLKMNTEG